MSEDIAAAGRRGDDRAMVRAETWQPGRLHALVLPLLIPAKVKRKLRGDDHRV
ncbi:MAG: hypothetical protein ACM3ML_30530 [Micromonosporaceae bacterium]